MRYLFALYIRRWIRLERQFGLKVWWIEETNLVKEEIEIENWETQYSGEWLLICSVRMHLYVKIDVIKSMNQSNKTLTTHDINLLQVYDITMTSL